MLLSELSRHGDGAGVTAGSLEMVPRRPTIARRWMTAATWPVGIALTSWDYMWRSTPMHRSEVLELGGDSHLPPPFPEQVDRTEVIGVSDGDGPLFHRRYRTRIREPAVAPEELFAELVTDLNRAAPTAFARFQRVLGDSQTMSLGDEYVVRMPGPWDGPVRVIDRRERSFRLATLAGHLEAGQIEFRVGQQDLMAFEIESWARSASRLSNVLYHRVRMAKEIQLHMWLSFLEGVVAMSGGRMTGGVEIQTVRVEHGLETAGAPGSTEPADREALPGRARLRDVKRSRMQHKLDALSARSVNYDPATVDLERPPSGWHVDDRFRALPAEPPGKPVNEGSWEIAGRLIRGYEFADPSIVRAFYDREAPLAGRDMLLELRALGLVRIYVGVRVGEVYDVIRTVDGRQVRVCGWNYRTLDGHVEEGQMDWEVWKWVETGAVQFHVHAVSRPAPIPNPIVRVGFLLLRGHERALFLHSTERRMVNLTELGLRREGRGERLRAASGTLTARRLPADDPAHTALARNVESRPSDG